MKFTVKAVEFEQFFMAARLSDASVFQYHDAIRVADGGKAVGDRKYGPVAHDPVEGLLHQFFGNSIEGTGCLIKDQNGRIA